MDEPINVGDEMLPVTAFTTLALPEHDLLILKLAFLSRPGQPAAEADPGRNYALTTPQVREAIDLLQMQLRRLEGRED